MQSFISWLDRILTSPLPEEIIAANFNLYDSGDKCWLIEFVGARGFDADNPDWVWKQMFTFRDNTLRQVQDTGWQQALVDTVHMMRVYLVDGTYAGRLRVHQGIGAGFIDRNIVNPPIHYSFC